MCQLRGPEFEAEFISTIPAAEHYFDTRPAERTTFITDFRRGLASYDGFVRDNLSWEGPWDFDFAEVVAPVRPLWCRRPDGRPRRVASSTAAERKAHHSARRPGTSMHASAVRSGYSPPGVATWFGPDGQHGQVPAGASRRNGRSTGTQDGRGTHGLVRDVLSGTDVARRTHMPMSGRMLRALFG